MAFIQEEDYRVVIGEAALKVVSQCSAELRANAEAEAQEEAAGYLRPRYDTRAAFAAEGDGRNRQLVMVVADMALYHMSGSLPQKMGSEVRQERYERAVRWLEGVAAGKIVPDLPVATGPEGQDAGGIISYHGEPKLRHNW